MEDGDHVSALAPGMTFAREYRVVRRLGFGGMGAVYVVDQLATGRQRALKVLHPYLVRDRKHRERFEQEARVGAGIRSNHVVEVIGAGVDDETGMPWLAMELLDGQDLLEFVGRRGPLEAYEVARIFQQLCHAVGAAHAIGVVHRDLKPENIFLAESRSSVVPFMVKVLDFGIAKVLEEGRTRTTAAIGTPMWMAPEQTETGARVTPSSDVWSLGLIAFWMLTGRSYWKGAADEGVSPIMLLREVVMEPIVGASKRAQDLACPIALPAGFDGWLERCLKRDPADRYPDAAQAHDALAPVLAAAVPSDRREDLPAIPLVDVLARTAPVTEVVPSTGPGATLRIDNLASGPVGSTTEPTTLQRMESPLDAGDTKVSPEFEEEIEEQPPRRPAVPRRWMWPVIAIVAIVVTIVGSAKYVRDEINAFREEQERKTQEERREREAEELKKRILAARAELDRIYGTMVRVEGGAFEMGAEGGNLNEQPPHRVSVDAFEIDVHEVAVAHYDRCVRAGKCTSANGPGCNVVDSEHLSHPVTCVTLEQARAFCASIQKRLPSEAEWEYAARGKDGRLYAWGHGEAAEQACWRRGASDGGGTCPVGAHPEDRGAFGVLDAAGNVREWTDSRYCPYARKDCGAESWVIRGGAWTDADPLGIRVTIRNGKAADYRSESVGFRCARDPR